MFRRVAIVLLSCLLVTACGALPRGAGIQSEVLAAGSGAEAAESFAVEPVTRDRLALYADWPAVGEQHYRWINRTDQPDTRVIRPGDTLAVTVWTTEADGLLTAGGERVVALPETRVSSGGTIFLPYAGDVRVAGMSPERARAVVQEKLDEVTAGAQVQLELAEGRASSVSVVSGVGSPGVYPLADQDVTVLDILAEAGGVRAGLNNPQIRLQRGGELFGTSVARLLEEPRLNTTLVGGDKVYVEEDDRYFLSLGAAGKETLHPFPKDRVTALDGLAIIGGVSEARANAQGILILRRYPQAAVRGDGSGPRHPRTVFTLDLTSADGLFSAGQFLIRPGDLVYVTESPVSSAQTVFGLIGSVFGLARQISN